MSKSAYSLRIFSFYMLIFGVVLIADPNWLFALFGVPETHEVWIRIVGMMMLIVGFIDFMASGNEMRLFFRWSVYARLAVTIFLIGFVVLASAPPVLLVFGAIDAGGAIWTGFCLRAEDLAKSEGLLGAVR
ncbi:MAG: hypothetical protein HZB47_12385 [Nitrosomonadales bacterium]|nr:hypothetical protein [Nitrosomonadales bacterium]